jgi:glucose/arabinose dehydrogenase/plastocyanin
MIIPESIEAQGGPISLVFSKGGRAFFSERMTGNIWEVMGKEDFRLVKHLPVVNVTGHHESGALGVTLDPDFEKNGNIYAYFTKGDDIEHALNEVVCFSVNGGEEKTIVSGIPASRIHNGGVMAFGSDGKLYIGTGVSNEEQDRSQDKSYLGGKVLRINSDGSIPADNPFKNSPVYSLGHRNVFGIAFHPDNGKLYISDVGPDNDDEINIIRAGGNYGWPEAVGFANDSRFIDPIIAYTPVITPTQMAFYGSDLYFASYNEGSLHKLVLSSDGDKVVSDTIVYQSKPFGLVGVFVSPEGDFFVANNNRISKIKLIKREVKMKNRMVMWVVVALVILGVVIGGVVFYNNSQNSGKTTNTSTQNVASGVITIQNYSFSPSSITISKGDTVTWQNNDSAIHRIVADDNSFDLGDVSNSGTSKYIFDKAGTYSYHCSIHPEMKGVVVVK